MKTDAKSVLGMFNKAELRSGVASRWVAYLQIFDFEVFHIKGADNSAADALPVLGHMPMQVFIQLSERRKVLNEIHGGGGGGHRRRESTLSKLRTRYFWLKMYNDTQLFVRACQKCQMRSRGRVEEPYLATWE
ncbi:Gypsy retrotransposon integrase-like protein 1 [Smittium culicis]|uniref:Gypsy retrotransposon integrase-like protein 1 n=1 Tax=Smittium culicis TaxID=133412 RepID=A0A1R1YPX0_9FUNG|nr:Gypsy retrotransposon integrase-like protein 1 [Smittium culicis]